MAGFGQAQAASLRLYSRHACQTLGGVWSLNGECTNVSINGEVFNASLMCAGLNDSSDLAYVLPAIEFNDIQVEKSTSGYLATILVLSFLLVLTLAIKTFT